MIKNICNLFGALVLVGCTLSPGLNINDSQLIQTEETEKPTDYKVTLITSELVLKENKKFNLHSNLVNNVQLEKALKDYRYLVAPQDVLNVIVFDHPELTTASIGQFRSPSDTGIVVDRKGYIYFPYIGKILVQGKSVGEIQNIIAEKLAKYVKNPQVMVRVSDFRSQKINVTGEVKNPGTLPITDSPITVVDAINKVGGPTTEADLKNVILLRNNRIRRLNVQELYDNGNLMQNDLLKDGDVLNIPDQSKNRVYVLGEVLKQNFYQMHKGVMTLEEALTIAGGLSIFSDPDKIYVIRGDLNSPEIYKLNANTPNSLLLASKFELKPEDVIYVSTAEVSKWNRVFTQILPVINSGYYSVYGAHGL